MSETLKPRLRAACLYRVSTASQVDHNGDLSVQKNSCRDFALHQDNWDIVFEYEEKGVSAFRNQIASRPVVMQMMADAGQGKFDIILVFMFDRLMRLTEEWVMLSKWFAKCGVCVWSVHEGELSLNDLLNIKAIAYLAEHESMQTSHRVSAAHKQMVQYGRYRGGTAPYGYRLVICANGEGLNDLEINPETSQVVREIFSLAAEQGWGANRIAQYLNKQAIPSATNRKWNTGTLNYIIRNPIYKGRMTYGKNKSDGHRKVRNGKEAWLLSQEPRHDLVIIHEQVFDKVQALRSSRAPLKTTRDSASKADTTGKLLFVGIIRCGHCGSPLTTTYNYKSYTKKDGVKTRVERLKYRCSGKALAKTQCDGQTQYAQEYIEEAVLLEIATWIKTLRAARMETQIKNFRKKHLSMLLSDLSKMERSLKEKYSGFMVYHGESDSAINGGSNELLNELMKYADDEIVSIQKKVREIQAEIKEREFAVNGMESLHTLPDWMSKLEQVGIDQKKIMLHHLIDSIVIYRDKIVVHPKVIAHEFMQCIYVKDDDLS